MTNFKTIKSMSSKIKEIALTVIFASSLIGLTLSANANASANNNLAKQVSNALAKQGDEVINELKAQLQQSIDNQISTFNLNYTLNDIAERPETESSTPVLELSSSNEVSTSKRKTNTTLETK